MLFNSLEFVALYLPLTLVGYYALIRLGLRDWIFLFLVVASLVFYSVWNPPYVLLLIGSVGGNYLAGLLIQRLKVSARPTWPALLVGIIGNLVILGWFKYANFFVSNVNSVAGTNWTLETIILPLAISFYTFQQIAYLVDVARDEVEPGGLWRYATFVIFFPQLIAGPIVHYRDMMPQFFGRDLGRFWRADLAVGIAIFAIGLFKKTVIADTAASFATPMFDAARSGETMSFIMGWRAAVCYTIQLYFDFSGYSDMAIGLARMFGIRLPVNFHSPLRAASIIEYWRRWHMTLQQFIVAYMYQPIVFPLARMAGARGLKKWGNFWVTVAAPTVIVFVVIGLWHGAAWTFVLFGLMHGVYLAVNEFWRAWRRKARRSAGPPGLLPKTGYHTLTLVCVAFSNVMFRAESPAEAVVIWESMVRFADVGSVLGTLPANAGQFLAGPLPLVILGTLLIVAFPNTQQLLGRYGPVLDWQRLRDTAMPPVQLRWRPSLLWAAFTGAVLFFGMAFIQRAQTEFIYFNF